MQLHHRGSLANVQKRSHEPCQTDGSLQGLHTYHSLPCLTLNLTLTLNLVLTLNLNLNLNLKANAKSDAIIEALILFVSVSC